MKRNSLLSPVVTKPVYVSGETSRRPTGCLSFFKSFSMFRYNCLRIHLRYIQPLLQEQGLFSMIGDLIDWARLCFDQIGFSLQVGTKDSLFAKAFVYSSSANIFKWTIWKNIGSSYHPIRLWKFYFYSTRCFDNNLTVKSSNVASKKNAALLPSQILFFGHYMHAIRVRQSSMVKLRSFVPLHMAYWSQRLLCTTAHGICNINASLHCSRPRCKQLVLFGTYLCTALGGCYMQLEFRNASLYCSRKRIHATGVFENSLLLRATV